MKLDPIPQPVTCDRCGKKTTKYVDCKARAETASANPSPVEHMAANLAVSQGVNDVCDPACWSVLLSCVKKAGPVEHKPRGARKGPAAP